MAIEISIQPVGQHIADEPFSALVHKNEVSLGSSELADVMLFGSKIAPIHAQVALDADGLLVVDMGSEHGTHLGSAQLEPFSRTNIDSSMPVVIGNYSVTAKWIESSNPLAQEESEDPTPSIEDTGYLVFDAVSLCDIRGTVTQAGVGIAGIRIDGGELGVAITDTAGEFVFHDIPEGSKYSLKASAEGVFFKPAVAEGRVVHSKVIEFEAIRLGALLGVVTHHGKALTGVRVDGGELGVCVTSMHGEFFFVQKPGKEQYRIRFSKPGYRFDPSYVEGAFDGRCLQLSVHAQKVRKIRGRVLHKGAPMAGVEINAGPLGSTITDSEGFYCFNDVPDGMKYRLVANKANFNFTPRISRVSVRD